MRVDDVGYPRLIRLIGRGQLLRCDYLPVVWQPDEDTQRLRELSAHRTGLVADQTRLKNRVRSLLAQRLALSRGATPTLAS